MLTDFTLISSQKRFIQDYYIQFDFLVIVKFDVVSDIYLESVYSLLSTSSKYMFSNAY